MAPPGKKAKPVFKTEVPFTETQWPQTSPKDQVVILDLLCNLLEPLGHHRKTHIPPSKGKKRKRKTTLSTEDNQAIDEDTPSPPPPELSSHILIGLNSVTRHLSSLATINTRNHHSTTPTTSNPKALSESESTAPPTSPHRPLSVLILPHPHPPSSLPHAHIPTLLALSTAPLGSPSPSPTPQPTRLVLLPSTCESRLSTALHIPRVGAIGILAGAPGADALVDYVREHVGLVGCGWVEEGLKGEWMGVKVGVSKG
ncbi:hypothetical protein P154DRAFT_565595 [Amniculicola lignicola CBS 123094]|uniref:Uncharacterized protein n=1 Tax=Amniculicola lignicola CBS 123094 TaxID=1392246 RepID=A0A6A5WD94_9PLEO|nr:hypothetical protein P154DRAFT_565595 [Amniculicola lignicola CBS 123094]